RHTRSKRDWSSDVCSSDLTEPNAGSDLQNITTKAVRDGDDWVINGAKTFITNGIHCDFVFVVARTDFEAKPSKGTSLFIVDADEIGRASCRESAWHRVEGA